MKQAMGIVKLWLTGVAVATSLAVSPVALAQAVALTYDLDDVWLLPDISHPFGTAQQMTGTFERTYQEGDFENGFGQFTAMAIPWYGSNIGGLNITIEPGSTEFSLIGNFHDRGVDLTLFMVEPLSPGQSSSIDSTRSQFEIQERGPIYKGHVVSGNIVPRPAACAGDADGDQDVDISDLGLLLSQFGMVGAGFGGDVDKDSDVDITDLGILLAKFGASCV